MSDGTELAPEGCVWVCGACGKTSPTRYGIDARNRHVAMVGWDESCMMNAWLVRERDVAVRSPSGRVLKLLEGAREVTDEVLARARAMRAADHGGMSVAASIDESGS